MPTAPLPFPNSIPTQDLSSPPRSIIVSGARVNTLKNLNCRIPHEALTVITGPSGSGKSSLAFDTLYAEGQRRFVESMSTYARQFLGRIEKPDVDSIQHILPAIALAQKNTTKNARSTVGTATDVDDYLRVLMATAGVSHCPQCHQAVIPSTPEAVEADLAQLPERTKLLLLVPLPVWEQPVPTPKGKAPKSNTKIKPVTDDKPLFDALHDHWQTAMAQLASQGYTRLEQHGVVLDWHEALTSFDLTQAMALVIDRVLIKHTPSEALRRLESVRQGFALALQVNPVSLLPKGEGVRRTDEGTPLADNAPLLQVLNLSNQHRQSYSPLLQCVPCGQTLVTPEPNLFSFNNPVGACTTCEGFGRVIGLDLDKVIPNRQLSLRDGAIHPFTTPANQDLYDWLMAEAPLNNVRLDVPFSQLSAVEQAFAIDGSGGKSPHGKQFPGIRGFFEWLETKKYKMHVRVMLARYRDYTPCTVCHGARLKPEALTVQLASKHWANVQQTPITHLLDWMDSLNATLPPDQLALTTRLRQEVTRRLQYLNNVGLGYLTLGRASRTLSGGEAQRIHLSSALGCALTDTLYVLDEPTVGLHARDTSRLLGILHALRDHGNTVVVVEHDPEMILGADYVLDLGPQGGDNGGRLMMEGTVADLLACTFSPTALALKQRQPSAHANNQTLTKTQPITIRGARGNNLKNITVSLPTNRLVCVTGVSGSGKSTLIKQTLYASSARQHGSELSLELAPHDSIEGLDQFKDVVMVDQSPPGRSSRSNPVMFVKAYDDIRAFYASNPRAKILGLTPSDFSFNTVGGRCDTCEGLGTVTIDMQFMADITVVCDACQGHRFKPMVLSIELAGKTINDVLNLTVDDAIVFFKTHAPKQATKIYDKLNPLQQLGLGYIRLGQPTATLSGGEAQRLKLATYLKDSDSSRVRAKDKPVLFLFDEPTTGLHLQDIDRLVGVLRTLLVAGHSLVVVEHNLDFIAHADHIIDFGPEGGDQGGLVVAEGSVPAVIANPASVTGQYLARAIMR
jgi:excinuclease ABC subunit A